ncbi:gliding motility-associated C-terminal domain-containing protein, partial [Flavobacterium sp. LB3R33]|uniref:T9SS type B sorting domain-containing protein n=1 Tax=Flavobacterium sp. LB3R33 TaxID=3401721 RepID=UPI003AAA9905
TWSTLATALDTTVECSDAEALATAQAAFPTATDLCARDVSNITKVVGAFVTSSECANAGTYTNTWTVNDDCGNTSAVFTQVITIQDTTAPTWSTLATALDTTVECSDAEALATAQAAFPTAADLCDTDVSNITKVVGAFVTSSECANAGTYTNTWTVNDDCGNTSAVFTQVITIQDTTAPTWSTQATALNTTLECSDTEALATAQAAFPTAADLCDTDVSNITKVVGAFVTSSECANAGTYTNTWTVNDDCGNTSAVFTQVITIQDTTAPTGTAPADITGLHSISEVPVGDVSIIIDEADNCSKKVDITIVDTNNGASGCVGNPYIITRTYILADCAGNTTSLIQKITVENNVSVSGIPTNVSCQGEKDGSIAITNSIGSTVVVTNNANEVVGSSGLPAGTYTLTATSSIGNDGQTCSAISTVTITEPNYRVRISGIISNRDTNLPLPNVPVTLIPQGATSGTILIRVTNSDGYYAFTGVTPGDYLLQVQDANLNNNQQLYSVDSNSFFTTIEECKYQIHNFEYEKSDLPVIGDFVWYDVNNNGEQDEWFDANNDGVVTQNIPDANGAIDYSLWEWIDFNGDNSFKGTENIGELNAAGLGNLKSSNILITGPNGYSKNVMLGIQGYYIDRLKVENPWGEYKVQLVMDSYLDIVSQAMGATGLVKVLSNNGNKLITTKTNKSESFTVCGPTTPNPKIIQITTDDRVHLDVDFGISCRLFANVDAKDDIFNAVQCTTNGIIGNVIDNDLLNELKTNSNEVNFKIITGSNPKITFDELGNITIQAGIKAGKYSFEYQICEKTNPTNCDNAFVTINIIDTTAPIWTTTVMPQDLTVQCDVPQPATLTATDSCGEVVIKYNEIKVDGNCVSNYLLTRVWTATDDSGNTISHTQKITVNDTTAPTTTTVFTPSINVNCDAIPAKPELVFVDNCSTVSPAIFTENIINRTENSYSIVRKWSVADTCGNASEFTQIINVTIPNSIVTINSSVCNDGETTTTNLSDLLPVGTPANGTWVDLNNSGGLQGSTLNAAGLPIGDYNFEYKVNDTTCPSTIRVIMTVNTGCGGVVLACGTVLVHNAFSPNGDGINEKFVIDNIDDTVCYPENTVEIYNRWGVLVFETKGYNNTSNSFDGVSGGRSTVQQSSGLPTGTYFYILNYTSVDNDGKIITNKKDGYLYLTK